MSPKEKLEQGAEAIQQLAELRQTNDQGRGISETDDHRAGQEVDQDATQQHAEDPRPVEEIAGGLARVAVEIDDGLAGDRF